MGKNMIFICALAAILDFCQLICFPPKCAKLCHGPHIEIRLVYFKELIIFCVATLKMYEIYFSSF